MSIQISFFFNEGILYSTLTFLTNPSSDSINFVTLQYLYIVSILLAEPLCEIKIPISPILTLLCVLFHLGPGIKSLGKTSISHLVHQVELNIPFKS